MSLRVNISSLQLPNYDQVREFLNQGDFYSILAEDYKDFFLDNFDKKEVYDVVDKIKLEPPKVENEMIIQVYSMVINSISEIEYPKTQPDNLFGMMLGFLSDYETYSESFIDKIKLKLNGRKSPFELFPRMFTLLKGRALYGEQIDFSWAYYSYFKNQEIDDELILQNQNLAIQAIKREINGNYENPLLKSYGEDLAHLNEFIEKAKNEGKDILYIFE